MVLGLLSRDCGSAFGAAVGSGADVVSAGGAEMIDLSEDSATTLLAHQEELGDWIDGEDN